MRTSSLSLLPQTDRRTNRKAARIAQATSGRIDRSDRSVAVRVGFPFVPVAIGVGLAGIVGYALLSSTSKKTTAHVDDSSAKQNAFDLGHDAGCAQGSEDKKAGASNAPPASSTLSGYAKSASPADYYAGYLKGYGECWATGVVTTYEVTPTGGGTTGSDGMRPGESAYDYGCRRGTASGMSDGKGGYDSAWDTNLASTGSLKRQAESKDPAQYKAGYKSCYIAAYAEAYAVYSTLKNGSLGGSSVQSAGDEGREAVRTGQTMAAIAVPSFGSIAGRPGTWGRRRTVLAVVNGPRVDRLSRVMGTMVGGVADVGHGITQSAVNVGCAVVDEAVKMTKTTVGLFFNTGRAVISSDSATPTYASLPQGTYGGSGYAYGYAQGRSDRLNGRPFNANLAGTNSGYIPGWNSI